MHGNHPLRHARRGGVYLGAGAVSDKEACRARRPAIRHNNDTAVLTPQPRVSKRATCGTVCGARLGDLFHIVKDGGAELAKRRVTPEPLQVAQIRLAHAMLHELHAIARRGHACRHLGVGSRGQGCCGGGFGRRRRTLRRYRRANCETTRPQLGCSLPAQLAVQRTLMLQFTLLLLPCDASCSGRERFARLAHEVVFHVFLVAYVVSGYWYSTFVSKLRFSVARLSRFRLLASVP